MAWGGRLTQDIVGGMLGDGCRLVREFMRVKLLKPVGEINECGLPVQATGAGEVVVIARIGDGGHDPDNG